MVEMGLMGSLEKEKLPSGWLNKFIRFSAILLVIVFIAYFGLHYGYERVLERRIAEVEDNIIGLEKEIASSDREEVSVFYSQLINLRDLLEGHIYSSQVFQRLELITHPQVAFTNFDYDFKEERLKLDGYSASLSAISEQILAFQRTADFREIDISDIRQAAQGRINFSAEVFFNPRLVLDKI